MRKPEGCSARLWEVFQGGLFGPPDSAEALAEFERRCDLADTSVTSAPQRTLPASVMVVSSPREIRAAEDAARSAAILAARRKGSFMGSPRPVAPKAAAPVKGAAAPAKAAPCVPHAPPEPTPREIKRAEVIARCLAGDLSVDAARAALAEIAEEFSSARTCPYCEDNPILRNTCNPCGGKGKVVMVTRDRPAPMVDARPPGAASFTYYNADGVPATGYADTGDKAVRAMIRMLGLAEYIRAEIDSGVILTLREHQYTCPCCNGKGNVLDTSAAPARIVRCDDCQGEGIVTRSRVTRLHFRDKLDKAGTVTVPAGEQARAAAVEAMSPEGYKRTLPLPCPKCKGKGCEGCGYRGRIFLKIRHWIRDGSSATIGTEIRRVDLLAEMRAPSADERLSPIGGRQVTTRPSKDPKWAMPKGWARHVGGKVRFNRAKFQGQNRG